MDIPYILGTLVFGLGFLFLGRFRIFFTLRDLK
jgi:hypothetical protein